MPLMVKHAQATINHMRVAELYHYCKTKPDSHYDH